MRILYDEAVQVFTAVVFFLIYKGIVDNLIRKSDPSQSTYVVQVSGGEFQDKMDHLTCFVPGMLALGAFGKTKLRDMQLAKDLMETCYNLYACSVTGLSPEVVNNKRVVFFERFFSLFCLKKESIM